MKKEAKKMISDVLKINPSTLEPKLIAFIRRKMKEIGADGAVLGISGGLDSLTAAALCKKALGRDKVLGICMPEAGITDPQDVSDARVVSNKLGIKFKVIDITPVVLNIYQNLSDFRARARIPLANVKPRVRMTILYYHANILNRLVVGTCNRSELRAGYFTKFGDGASDILPLGSFYKTQVKKLAANLKIPKWIIEKKPSAGLWRGQTDEKELGISYEKLDMIYAGLDLGLDQKKIAEAAGVKVVVVKNFVEREQRIAHKLKMPEIAEF